MKFHEKRPVFEAEQFDGMLDSARSIVALLGRPNVKWTITRDEHDITLSVDGHVIEFGQWLVRLGGGYMVLTSREFSARFEVAP